MRAAIAVLTLGGLGLVSCQKEPEPIGSDQVLMVVDQAIAERCLLPLWPVFNDLGIGPGNWGGHNSNACLVLDSIQGDTAGFPSNGTVTAFLSFEAMGCSSPDGAIRSGALIVTFGSVDSTGALHGRFRAPDLLVDEHRVRMMATWQGTGVSEWMLMVDTSSIFFNGDWSRRFTGRLDQRLIEGERDGNLDEDAYHISTELIGRDRDGASFGCSTTTELRLEMSCGWIVSGVERFDASDELARELDLGTGSCDDLARITAENTVFGLTIP